MDRSDGKKRMGDGDGKKRMGEGDGGFFAHKGPEWRYFRMAVSMVTNAGTRIPHKELNMDRLIKFPFTGTVHIKPLHQQEFRNT